MRSKLNYIYMNYIYYYTGNTTGWNKPSDGLQFMSGETGTIKKEGVGRTIAITVSVLWLATEIYIRDNTLHQWRHSLEWWICLTYCYSLVILIALTM